MNRNPLASKKKSGGFSLFELVAFIICVAIIYAVAANRFSQFPGAAERANFLSVVTQVQSGINLETLLGVSRGDIQRAGNLEGSNPMEILLQPPANYIGAFDIVDKERLPRRSWYFDMRRRELVYLVNDIENVFVLVNDTQIPADELRFKIETRYSYEDRLSGRDVALAEIGEDAANDLQRYRKRFTGALMVPVTQFSWDAPAINLPEFTDSDSQG